MTEQFPVSALDDSYGAEHDPAELDGIAENEPQQLTAFAEDVIPFIRGSEAVVEEQDDFSSEQLSAVPDHEITNMDEHGNLLFQPDNEDDLVHSGGLFMDSDQSEAGSYALPVETPVDSQPASHEVLKEPEFMLSRNDEELLYVLLDRDDRGGSLYDRLVERTKGVWRFEDERQGAIEGMTTFIETIMDGVIEEKYRDMDEARTVIGELFEPGSSISTKSKEQAKSLFYQKKYQTISGSDFLHFESGHSELEGVTEDMKGKARIYVTPKLEFAGMVGAEVIKKAREEGYAPKGKIYDTVTDPEGPSDRLDRLIFYTSNKKEQDIILSSLADIAESNPKYFEDRTLLLTEETGIKGVGFAEDPPSGNSFNDERAMVLRQALFPAIKTTVEEFGVSVEKQEGVSMLEFGVAKINKLLDGSSAEEKARIRKSLITQLKKELVGTVGIYGVSSENFARNA